MDNIIDYSSTVAVGVREGNERTAIYILSTAEEVISVLKTNFVGKIKVLTPEELADYLNNQAGNS